MDPPGSVSVPPSQSSILGISEGFPVSERHTPGGLQSKVFLHSWGGWKVQDQGVPQGSFW